MAFCDFGKVVKKKLVDIDKSQEWLMEEVRERTGLFIDNGYLYKILTGQRSAPKIVDAICDVLGIKDESQG